MAVTTLAVIGLLYLFTTQASQPGMTLLYGELDPGEASTIAGRLESMGIAYELSGNGSQIMVPPDAALPMRMALAEEGLPSGGGSIGYEIFDRNDAFGAGRALMDINMVRALEGELARTIRTIRLIQGARVHLSIPKRELFDQNPQEPTASIIVKVRGGNRLTQGQVAGIQQVVAAAVPGLLTSRVSVVDDQGNLLARGDGSADTLGAMATAAEDYRAAVEMKLKAQIENLLQQSVGWGRVRAEVSAEIDFDRLTSTSEVFDPDGQVVRSTQTIEDGSSSSEITGDPGVTVENELPQEEADTIGASTSESANRTEEQVTYEISKTIENLVREAGSIRRLSVAVLVDGTTTTDAEGKSVYQPRSQEELDQLTALVRSAVGYDADRGDVVEVVNMPFARDLAVELEEGGGPPLGLMKADYMRIAQMAITLIGGVLIMLLVIRPLLAHAFRPAVPALAAAGVEGGAPQLAGPGASPAQIAAQPAAAESLVDVEAVDGKLKESSLNRVGEIIDKHPEETLNILRNWLYEEA
jgi:flagellar M-ring protein FliF